MDTAVTKTSMVMMCLMCVVMWLCVCTLSHAALTSSSSTTLKEEIVFHDKAQEDFLKSLSDYVITIPTRVTSDGGYVTHQLHAKHMVIKRHAPLPPHLAKDTGNRDFNDSNDVNNTNDVKHSHDVENDSGETTVMSNDVIHYRIPVADGKEVIVRLRENRKLFSPGAVVETRTRKFMNASDSQFKTLEHARGCHLTGSVMGDGTSRAALAACDGLSGFFHTEGEHYIIEPVKGHKPGQGSHPHQQHQQHHPHVVYKRSALPQHLHSDPSSALHGGTCGVQDDIERIINRRERWERHRRNAENRRSLREEEEEDGQRGMEGRRKRRKKRSISIEKNTETLVVVDPEMMKYYQNEDVENYVLTVMNMVSTLFYDASIGNAVNIVIVRLMLMKEADDDLEITHHADKTLRSFCKWQKTVNFRDDDHPNHHDVALLLTRRNICNRMNKPCSTLGLAQVSGMCQPHRSCNINEDTGLSLAWTVTHELGHNFGMKHDTKHNDCLSPPGEMYVMAPHLSWDLTPTRWSSCSRLSVTKFLDRDWGYCLDDEPGHHDFQYPVLPAGTMYDADHQCRLLYGEDASLCGDIQDLENICSTLWCRVNNKCSTKLQPAAEGTICGPNKWCFAGKCVEIGDRQQAINGEWGEWGQWTPCSRTCGAGVSHSQRLCNHPPPSNGGKYCIGERKRYRICNTDGCPDDGVSFRHVQCSEFNDIPYKGKKYEWIPVPTPESPCQLHCKPKDMFFSVLLKDVSTDGTPCVPGARHMCISGRCRNVGCDWEIDSSATEDRCGVCYGDGSTCKTIKQQFNETKEHGYVEATVIPQGARNIRVEEVAGASNFLALRNEEGVYYLNGHWFIQWSGDYEMAGTVVRYDRKGNKESFKAVGPLKEPLHIMLLMQTHNPGVVFEYTVPKENATDNREPEFRWDFTDWSHCTLSCGGGTQRSAVFCTEKEAGRVDDMFCDSTSKPDDRLRTCNEHLCPARWWHGPWQHCSETCGDKGTHKRSVMCVRSLGADEQIALEDAACQHMDKPNSVEPCKAKEPCPGSQPVWMTGNWTQCNGNPCAIQTRTVVCSDVTEGCDPFTRPEGSRACTNVTCGNWETSDWSDCTRTCEGVQYRKVTCVGGTTCDLDLEPPAQQPCGESPCPQTTDDNSTEINRQLFPLPTSKTSKTTLSQTPHTEDVNVLKSSKTGQSSNTESNNVVLGETSLGEKDSETDIISSSPRKDVKPSSTSNTSVGNKETSTVPEHKIRHHHNKHHHRHHKKQHAEAENSTVFNDLDENEKEHNDTGKETNGDRDKEHGDQKQNGDDTQRKQENEDEEDTEEQQGGTADDDFEWYTGEWRKCSSECGAGVQTRSISCYRVTSAARVDSEFCSIATKPSAIQECNTDPCADWMVSEWTQCSATCGYAVRQRNVTCPEGGLCESKFKPRDVQVCSSLSPCIAWVTGDWSKCSKTCDGGTQQRMVQCVNRTSQMVSASCDGALRPSERQSCNTDSCPAADAAFAVKCETNEMSYKVCRMLKKVGLCHKDYVKTKCCRTCTDHSRKSPANRIADLR